MTEQELSFIHHYRPAGTKAAPTLLLLHGTGADENSLLPLANRLVQGANLLSPRGKVMENGMARFFRRIAIGVFDVEDLIERTHELAEFIIEASSAYGFDRDKLVAVGFSNGANIAASLLLLHPSTLAAAILFKAQVPFEPDQISRLAATPVFLAAGRGDELIEPADTERLIEILREAGAQVTPFWTEGGHQLTLDEVEAASEWLRRLPVLGN